jgi:hypothetical protein
MRTNFGGKEGLHYLQHGLKYLHHNIITWLSSKWIKHSSRATLSE